MYEGEINRVDFAEEVDKIQSHVNEWVAERTDKKIEDLLAEEDIKPDEKLMLVNAAYFKGFP